MASLIEGSTFTQLPFLVRHFFLSLVGLWPSGQPAVVDMSVEWVEAEFEPQRILCRPGWEGEKSLHPSEVAALWPDFVVLVFSDKYPTMQRSM